MRTRTASVAFAASVAGWAMVRTEAALAGDALISFRSHSRTSVPDAITMRQPQSDPKRLIQSQATGQSEAGNAA